MRKKRLGKRAATKVGASPGTLVHVGESRTERIGIQVMAYDSSRFVEQRFAAEEAQKCAPFRQEPPVCWINVDGIHQVAVVETLGRCFDLHPLVMEDILNTEQRPKLEDYDSYLFLVVKMLHFDGSAGEIRTEQVSLILGKSFVISFQEASGDVFDGVRDRIRQAKGRVRQMGADYLAYALLDAVVDSYFVILDRLGDEIEALEEELVTNPRPKTLEKIHAFKREMILLRKSIWPLREVISGLQRQGSDLVQPAIQVFLRDVYDHTIQVVDTVETFRDLITGLLDLYLSSLSIRMNEVMKVLTIIATIFIPLTFIAGVYGMNFEYMPELTWRWAYPALWLLMLLIAAGMFVFFRKKKWL